MQPVLKNIATILTLSLVLPMAAMAGPGTGAGSSSALQNTHVAFGTTVQVYSERLYIGPGNNIIDGTLEVFSNQVWIAPTANITGPGTIIFRNPADNPFWEDMPAAATRIDHNNGAPVEVNIRLLNPNNLQLTDIADPGFGTPNPTGALAAALHLGNDLDLAVNNGDIILNGNDLVIGPSATISNYSQFRMVVTGNSIAGHIVKEAATGTYTYPVGIAEGNYTPASITPGTLQTIHVSVTDYNATAATIEAPQEGMNRTWHVYADNSTNVSLSLQHNISTNGSAYNDNLAFITQYMGGNAWSSQPVSGYVAAGLHALNNFTLATVANANGAWLTKTSDAITPLPVVLTSFEATAKNCDIVLTWRTATETNFDHFEIERSNDGSSFTKTGTQAAKGNNSSYSFYDKLNSSGKFQYRLKIVDRDGQENYSRYATVNTQCDERQLAIYPNPTQNIVYITGLSGTEKLQLFDALGRSVFSGKVPGTTTSEINLVNFANGAYNLVITGKDSKSFKIIKRD